MSEVSKPHSSDFAAARRAISANYSAARSGEQPSDQLVHDTDRGLEALVRLEEQLREEQRAFRAYKEHVMRTVEAFVEEVRP